MKVLAIIPARGGSKGIPKKNIRLLSGQPLINYAIENAKSCKYITDVYLASDDQEIISVAKKLNVKTVLRDKSDSDDAATLDAVIFNALNKIQEIENKIYDIVVTLQVTSPLLEMQSLTKAFEKMLASQKIDTVISCVNDTHLTWRLEDGIFRPNYSKRLNRQYLQKTYRETGGFLISRSENISKASRIGTEIELYELTDKEAIDIDTYSDWALCEFYLKRKKIVIVVSGYREIGLGHVYNSLLIAADLIEHEVVFLVDHKSELAAQVIKEKNYKVHKQSNKNIIQDICQLKPEVIINDILDTSLEYVQALKSKNYKVINFEDLGAGSRAADLTFNAIYPEKEVMPNHFFGPEYFLLREEFLVANQSLLNRNVSRVLITFGGIDPNNYTKKVIDAIYEYCFERNIKIHVVVGLGYDNLDSLKVFSGVSIFSNVTNISEHMSKADIIFTSAGRTTYEIASLAVPTIVLAQNERELTHLFASSKNGFINLGLGINVDQSRIRDIFLDLIDDFERRKNMAYMMSRCDLRSGRTRVVKLIREEISA